MQHHLITSLSDRNPWPSWNDSSFFLRKFSCDGYGFFSGTCSGLGLVVIHGGDWGVIVRVVLGKGAGPLSSIAMYIAVSSSTAVPSCKIACLIIYSTTWKSIWLNLYNVGVGQNSINCTMCYYTRVWEYQIDI